MSKARLIKYGFIALVALSCSSSSAVLGEQRQMSLVDCIQEALGHNLSLQIERINPELNAYDLNVAYASYEPQFTGGYTRVDRTQPGQFNPTIGTIPGTKTETDRFNAGINGLLPTGLTYNFSGDISDLEGERPFDGPFGNNNGSVGVNLRQPLLRNAWIDSTRLNIKIAKNRLDVSELQLLWQIMNIVTNVEVAYYDLIFAIENVKVQETAVELAEQLLKENKKRVEVGAMAPLDEKQAESQVAARRADLLGAKRNLAIQQNALKNLLSDEYTTWEDTTIRPLDSMEAIPVALNRQSSWQKGMTLRPDLEQLRRNARLQGTIVKFNKNQLFPQLDVVGSLRYAGSTTDRSFTDPTTGLPFQTRANYNDTFTQIKDRDNPTWTVGGQLTIPLGNRAARNNLKSAKASERQLLLQLKQFEQDVMVRIENAVTLAQISLQRVDATRQGLEFAVAALDAEQKKLENGKSTSFFVLQLQRDLTAASSSQISALAEYNKSISFLALEEGSTLQRHNAEVTPIPSEPIAP